MQYIIVSNQCVVHLKLRQYYMSIMSVKLGEGRKIPRYVNLSRSAFGATLIKS